MDLITKPFADLNQLEIEAWRNIQAENPRLDSPHFCIEMARIADATRGDIHATIIADDGIPVGILPFHRNGNRGTPPAGPLASFQGGIFPANANFDLEEVTRAAGLRVFHFDHLIDSQPGFERWKWFTANSYSLDLSEGYEAYYAGRRKAGSDKVKQMGRKSRKMARDLGTRFEFDCRDINMLNGQLTRKSCQLDEMGVWNFLRESWTTDFLRQVFHHTDRDFAGVLSVLYANEEIAAMLYSYRHQDVLHGNVLTYNRAFEAYSPGLQIIMEVAKACEAQGIKRLDLGRGDDTYKTCFASDAILVAEGAIDRRMIGRRVSQGWLAGKSFVSKTSVAAPARRIVRKVRNWTRTHSVK